jgi:hypothetical protein
MTIATFERHQAAGPLARLGAVPLWGWTALAVLASTALALLAKGPGRAFELIDSDDALRLVHVRELIAGQPWMETTTKALGGEQGLVSHWSRLLDGPLALLLVLFRSVLPEASAQNALVTVWPVLMLGCLMWAIARSTLAAHGRDAAHFALAVGALGLLSYYQFAPGRIDHHSAMIAASVAAALLIWAWPDDRKAWRWSGVLAAIAIAVGYEALAPVAVVALLAAGWGLLDRGKNEHAAAWTIGFAATLAIVFIATVPPARWLTITCDALALNVVALVAIAGGGFVLAMRRGQQWSAALRLGVVGVAGAAGLIAFGMLEPVCLRGPMAQVPGALGPIWIEHVEEAKSLLAEFMRGHVAGTIGTIAVLCIGTAAACAGLAASGRPADRLLIAATLGFVLLALWQMKFVAYASMILVPGMAVLIARLPSLRDVRAPLVRAGALLLLNQFALISIATAIGAATAGKPDQATTAQPAAAGSPQHACTRAADLRALAGLPAGLVVTHNDIGAHLVLQTPLRALSGPYHRIPDAIIANHVILSAPSDLVAGRELARVGADYVIGCDPLDVAQARFAGWEGSLVARISKSQIPPYLVAVPVTDGSPFKVWRFDRSRLPAP